MALLLGDQYMFSFFKWLHRYLFRRFRSEIKVRKVRHGDYIFLERKTYMFFGLIQTPFRVRWKPLNNHYLKTHQELNKISDKFKKTVQQYQSDVELYQRERDELGRRLEGDWLDYPLGPKESLNCEALIDEPTNAWKRVINPKLAKFKDRFANSDGTTDISDLREDTRADVGAGDSGSIPDNMPCSARTVYIPEEMAQHAMILKDLEGADNAMGFKKPQEKKADPTNDRKRQKGESAEDHRIRLEVLAGEKQK